METFMIDDYALILDSVEKYDGGGPVICFSDALPDVPYCSDNTLLKLLHDPITNFFTLLIVRGSRFYYRKEVKNEKIEEIIYIRDINKSYSFYFLDDRKTIIITITTYEENNINSSVSYETTSIRDFMTVRRCMMEILKNMKLDAQYYSMNSAISNLQRSRQEENDFEDAKYIDKYNLKKGGI